jgi:DNA-binding transcriptional regulator YiaG
MRGWKMDGTELKQRREKLGLSVNKLAHEFRCAASSIKRWEEGDFPLEGLQAWGADTVLRRLETEQRREKK